MARVQTNNLTHSFMDFILKFSIIMTLLFSTLAHAHTPLPMLVTSTLLNQNITTGESDAIIIDLRKAEEYQAGHIPTAINIPMADFHRELNGVKGFVISPLSFQSLASEHGITPNKPLVFYSNKIILDATRAFWVFDLYGHKGVSILDGGYASWLEKGFPISSENHVLPKSNYTVDIRSDKLSSKFNIQTASILKNQQIIDARPTEEYVGEKTKGARSGHIPNADSLPWKNLVKEGDKYHSLLPTPQLREKMYQVYDEDKNTILYCNGGKESSVIYFGLRLLGKNASVYDGSWNEWSSDLSLPITVPSASKQSE